MNYRIENQKLRRNIQLIKPNTLIFKKINNQFVEKNNSFGKIIKLFKTIQDDKKQYHILIILSKNNKLYYKYLTTQHLFH